MTPPGRPSANDVRTRLRINAPSPFSFWETVRSHGWCLLPPFFIDQPSRTLTRVFTVDGDKPVICHIAADGKSAGLNAYSRRALTAAQRERLMRDIRSCLRLDEDFSAFYAAARRSPRYRWIASRGAGRLLRSPTVFEDAVKMICTTNCTWALTTLMIKNLVEAFGEPAGDGGHAFPLPGAIAGSTERFLRTHCSTGYRSAYLLELSRQVASGSLDIESWRTSVVSTEELFRQMRAVKGVGPYAAGNLLKLSGRYDYLGLDSWVRGEFYRMHTRGRKVKDRTIERHYASLGPWRGLFFWFEMTGQWRDEVFEK